jgi:hypothetical protein
MARIRHATATYLAVGDALHHGALVRPAERCERVGQLRVTDHGFAVTLNWLLSSVLIVLVWVIENRGMALICCARVGLVWIAQCC